MAAERIYRAKYLKGGGYICVAVGLIGFGLGIYTITIAHGATANRGFVPFAYVSGVLYILIAAGVLWLGARMSGMRVVVTPDSITTHSLMGRGRSTQQASRDEIQSIDLMSHAPVGLNPNRFRAPYVTLKQGGGFFLDALSGAREDRPIKPEQQQRVDQIRTTPGVSGSDGSDTSPSQNWR